MSQIKKEGRVPLVLDSGNLFFNQSPLPDEIKPQMVLKSDVIGEAYKKIGIDALNVGEMDLALGVNFLLGMKKKHDLPFVSSNIVYRDSGKNIFKPFIIKEVNGLKVAIFGLLPAIRSGGDKEINILSTEETAKGMVGRLRKKADIVILLSNLGQNEDEKLAKEITGIDMIVGGRNRALLQTPVKVGGTLILQAQAQGKQIGRLDFHPADRTFVNIISPMDDKVHKNEEIEEMIKKYKETVNSLHFDKPKPAIQAVQIKSYVGESECAKCHPRQSAFWKGTRHAKAYDTLVKKGSQGDLECIGCHTTGYGIYGGFRLGMDSPSLINVQCESCHGSGGMHKGKGDIRRVMDVSVCRGCHAQERDPKFNINSSLGKVRCPK